MIGPLNSSYELNPVAREAQASVPVPEGLDLDSWIIPPPKEDVMDALDGMTNGVARKKKGKGKEKAEKGAVKGKKKEKGISLVDMQAEETETAEERAERERVSRNESWKRLRIDQCVRSGEQKGWNDSRTTHII